MNLLPYKHIWYTSSESVNDIAINLFRALQLRYFRFFRLYKNGDCIRLSTNPDWTKHYLREGYLKLGAPYKYFNPSGTNVSMVTSTNNPLLLKVIKDLEDRHNISHGISIYKPYKNYINFFDFATYKENDDIMRTYVENFPLIEAFTSEFLLKASGIIKDAEKQMVNIDFEGTDIDDLSSLIYLFKNVTLRKSYYLEFPNKKIKLSQKQAEVLALLLKGYKSKQISKKLEMTGNTFYFHISRLFEKFNCTGQATIINLIHDNAINLHIFDELEHLS